MKGPYEERRPREELTPLEVRTLLDHVRTQSKRDYALFLLMYRHGLRVTEALSLRWSQVDSINARLTIKRLKNGISNGVGRNSAPSNKLELDELHALGDWYQLAQARADNLIFPIKKRWAHALIAKYGRETGLPFPIHPHMLRHSCATHLAPHVRSPDEIKALQWRLGHRALSSTLHYVRIDKENYDRLGGLMV